MTEKRGLVLHECPSVSFEADPVAAELAALRAENEALKEQITRLQRDSTAQLLKHRNERTVLRATLKHISDELYERSDVEDDGRGGQRMNWPAYLRVHADAALSATTGGKEARDARSEG